MSAEQNNRFKDLQMKNQKVIEGAMKINAQIEHAQETRKKLKEAAKKKFDEDDLDKIKAKAALWKQENDNINNELESNVNKIELEVQLKGAIIKQAQQNPDN